MFRRTTTAQAKRRRLSFRLEHLEAVRSGRKVATVRFSAAAARIRPGDALTLAFGRRDRPTVLQASAVRSLELDLEPELHRCFDLAPSVLSSSQRDFYARPLEPDANTAAALLEALRDSGGDFEAVLLEAAERTVTSCTAVWWSLID